MSLDQHKSGIGSAAVVVQSAIFVNMVSFLSYPMSLSFSLSTYTNRLPRCAGVMVALMSHLISTNQELVRQQLFFKALSLWTWNPTSLFLLALLRCFLPLDVSMSLDQHKSVVRQRLSFKVPSLWTWNSTFLSLLPTSMPTILLCTTIISSPCLLILSFVFVIQRSMSYHNKLPGFSLPSHRSWNLGPSLMITILASSIHATCKEALTKECSQ